MDEVSVSLSPFASVRIDDFRVTSIAWRTSSAASLSRNIVRPLPGILAFYSGYPGCEFQIREALAETIGEENSEYFFDQVCQTVLLSAWSSTLIGVMQFLEAFFQDADAAFFKSLGLNCIRLPFNYRHFEGTTTPHRPL
jgi:hypothetical protein